MPTCVRTSPISGTPPLTTGAGPRNSQWEARSSHRGSAPLAMRGRPASLIARNQMAVVAPSAGPGEHRSNRSGSLTNSRRSDVPSFTITNAYQSPGRSPVNADIVIPDCLVVIEFDGSHYHRGEEAAARDTPCDSSTRSRGMASDSSWSRPPLERLAPNDVAVPDGRDTKAVTTDVLQRLKGLGHTPARADDYLSDPNLWAVARADEDIHARFSRSLSSLFPEIAAEWHPTRNGDRHPEYDQPRIVRRAWWKCPSCGHAWNAMPKKRTVDGSGCC